MEGWHGWDDYAPFYDWENAQTVQRRDIGVLAAARARGVGARCSNWAAAPAA